MSESNEQAKKLILLKSKLEYALQTDQKEDIIKYFEEFKALYEQITSKKFEDGISDEKLAQIESVIKDIKISKPEISTDEERYN